MRRVVAGSAALAMAAVGSVGFAGPVGAEAEEVNWDLTALHWDDVNVDHEALEGSLSPDVVAPGTEVTVTAECDLQRLSDPLHPHEVRWALVEPGEFPGWDGLPDGLEFTAVDQGTVTVPGPAEMDDNGEVITREDVEVEEGDFLWEVTFAAPEDAGDYEFVAICAPVDLESYPHCHIGTYGPADLTLEVDDELPPEVPDEPETVTPPAPPVVGEPELTG